MRILFSVIGLVAVAACQPVIPESGAGVGFGSYDAYQTEVDAQLTGNPVPLAAISDEVVGGGADIAADTSAALASTAAATSAASVPGAPLSALTIEGQRATIVTSNPAMSDEQDFAAVSGRETIASDQQRITAQRQQYQVVETAALPTRDGNSGPNIVAFALATTNPVGQAVHRRSGLFMDARYERNCAKYSSPDLAQEAFLRAGGPESDRYSLDPDGDGFACAWDPTPYRLVNSTSSLPTDQ